MKKITLLFTALLFGFSSISEAQTLNQNASWPNAAWTVTGTYNTDPLAFEADPTTTVNFAFDDDDAGNGNDDDIAAESPVIDLTAAHTNGETWITISGDYVYNRNSGDILQFEYWDTDAGTWNLIGAAFPADTAGAPNDNFCAGTAEAYTTTVLNIGAFTPTQLSGFRYRIFYDDTVGAAGWEWGFCFQSPTIVSATPPTCADPLLLAVSNMTSTTADLSWTEVGTATLWDIELLDITAGDTVTGTATNIGVVNPFTATGLTEGNDYEFYVRSDCGINGVSNWAGPFAFTLIAVPVNDDCSGAISLTVNPDLSCGSVVTSTINGATASGIDEAACSGTEDDDVWFSFVATATNHVIELINISGGTTDLYHSLWEGVDCNSLSLVAGTCSDPNTSTPSGLTIGNTYFVRVYSWTATPGQTTNFDICVGTPPPPPVNDDCANATPYTNDFTMFAEGACVGTPNVLDLTSATDDIGSDDPSCDTFSGNYGVWFTWTATSTGLTFTDGIGDPGLAVYEEGTCGSLVEVGCINNASGTIVGLTISNNYILYIWDDTAGTTVEFCLEEFTAPPPPVNDECTDAISLTVGAIFSDNPIDGTVAFATADAETNGCGSNGSGVWYSVVVPADGEISIETGPDAGTGDTGFDSVIEVFSGACGSLTSIDCDDDGATTGGFSLLDLTGLTPSSTIYIRVWEYGGNEVEPFSVSAYSATLSVGSLDNENTFTYFPNPTKNSLTLKAANEIQNVSIYNMLGQEVLRTAPNAIEKDIDMSSLQTGTYFVQVTINDVTETVRIIKQ